MKNILLITATLIITQVCNAQPDSLYFGQTPPGDTAVIFAPGIISKANRDEFSITFSPNGKECFFNAYDSSSHGIFYTKYMNNAWTEQVEATFSVDLNHSAKIPFFSADGKRLYFDSNNDSIGYVERVDSIWSEPHFLPAPINSDSADYFYSETADGVGYFSSKRTGSINNSLDIWRVNLSTGQPYQVENLGSIVNSGTEDFSSCIAPDGSYIIFASDRSSKYSEQSLWISFNKGENEWTRPVDMEESKAKINIPNYWQISPSLSPDGKYLFFCHHAEARDSIHIFWVSTHIIGGLKKVAFAPRLNKKIPNFTINTDSEFTYIIPENTFSCEYGTDSLKYTASLSNGLDLPLWLTFDPETRTLSGTPEQEETDSIKITVTYADTASAECNFKIRVKATSNISQLEQNKIEIFPNPASLNIQVKGIDILLNDASYKLTDLNGKTIKQGKLNSKTIDISELPKGIYMLGLNTSKGIITEKVVVE